MKEYHKETYIRYAHEIQSLFSSEYTFHTETRLKYIDTLLGMGATLGNNAQKNFMKILIDMYIVIQALNNADLDEYKFVLIRKEEKKNIKLPLSETLLATENRLRIIANIHSLNYDALSKKAQEIAQNTWESEYKQQREQVRTAKELFGIPLNQGSPKTEILKNTYRRLAKQNMQKEPDFFKALEALVEIELDDWVAFLLFEREREPREEYKEQSKQSYYSDTSFEDAYKVLGLTSSASFEEVKAKVKALRKQSHPDIVRGKYNELISKEKDPVKKKILEMEKDVKEKEANDTLKNIHRAFDMIEQSQPSKQ